ncbi:MAG: hypothetical protein IJ616_03620 [Bacteroidales bacterium]|nr:hypothetical protein [Bacteroidales bacterium]
MVFDKKAQMMDAGMVLFPSDEPFGHVLGMVKTAMTPYGKVWRKTDLEGSVLPDSLPEFDLFLDRSTPWRKRYISAWVEDAGDGRYALTFREGNRSTTLRAATFILLIFACVLGAVCIPGIGLLRPALWALAGWFAYRWIVPARNNRKAVEELMRKFK